MKYGLVALLGVVLGLLLWHGMENYLLTAWFIPAGWPLWARQVSLLLILAGISAVLGASGAWALKTVRFARGPNAELKRAGLALGMVFLVVATFIWVLPNIVIAQQPLRTLSVTQDEEAWRAEHPNSEWKGPCNADIAIYGRVELSLNYLDGESDYWDTGEWGIVRWSGSLPQRWLRYDVLHRGPYTIQSIMIRPHAIWTCGWDHEPETPFGAFGWLGGLTYLKVPGMSDSKDFGAGDTQTVEGVILGWNEVSDNKAYERYFDLHKDFTITGDSIVSVLQDKEVPHGDYELVVRVGRGFTIAAGPEGSVYTLARSGGAIPVDQGGAWKDDHVWTEDITVKNVGFHESADGFDLFTDDPVAVVGEHMGGSTVSLVPVVAGVLGTAGGVGYILLQRRRRLPL